MTVLSAGQVHWLLWCLNVRCKFAFITVFLPLGAFVRL